MKKPTQILLGTLAVSALLESPGAALPGMGSPKRDDYVAAWGVRMEDFGRRFGGDGQLQVDAIECSVPCNIAYPGERVSATIQFRNRSGQELALKGRYLLLDETFITRGDDVFNLGLQINGTQTFGEVDVVLPPNSASSDEIDLPIGEKFGSWVLLFERADTKTRLLVASYARIIDPANEPGRNEYQICMDIDDPALIARLKTASNRIGIPYVPSDDSGCERTYERIGAQLEAIGQTGYPICVEFGGGPERGKYLPLGRSRPHLTEDNILLETKSDFAWLPSYDDDFKQRVKWVVKNYGYPKGPVNALMLWNEPWNGLSISGWGADELRYREIYTAMCEAAVEAMAEAAAEGEKINVLLGGCDSSANTFDKLFCDGDMKFLPWLDFLSLHYQGLSPSNARFMRDRQHPNGRVRFWDTESWVANSPDRVPGVISGMLAAGHDRLVGIMSQNVCANTYDVEVVQPDGKIQRRRQYGAWPVAPALAAFQHFVGNRPFERILWEGTPWVYLFRGSDPEDLTAIVCGDIVPAFEGSRRGIVPFWTSRNGEAVKGSLTLANASGLSLYDGLGNAVASGSDTLAIPLSADGFYLRADGTPGSAERLLAALAAARVEGLVPVAPTLRDATAPIAPGTTFSATLKNLLNREITGTLSITAEGLTLEYDHTVTLPANGSVTLPLTVTAGTPSPLNTYPFALTFDAGADGRVSLNEKLHCNLIANLTPALDGNLGGWDGALPQVVAASAAQATLMETAWLPMVKHDDTPAPEGTAAAWLAADDNYFYFAAKIFDTTDDPGMMRYETRDEDADFYPSEVVQYDTDKTFATRPGTTRIKLPVGDGSVWGSLCSKMAFRVTPPVGGQRVALLLADDDGLNRRHISVTLTTDDGKRTSFECRPQMDKTWLRFNVTSPTRVEIATRNWLKPQIAAVAFDPLEDNLAREAYESDKGQGFVETYGEMALATPANPGDFAWVEEVVDIHLTWPEGVRHFTYRRRPVLPQGQGHDNVQLAFNVLSDDDKPWYPAAPGAFKGYSGYWDTDYEFALNPVADEFGGGTEIWTCRAPGLPDKHYYPRAPKHPNEGPVKGGRLNIWRNGDYRFVECALPWSAIPEVKAARDAHRPIKFTYKVNDNSGRLGCLELANLRSASKRNENAFRPAWCEHWANEIVFDWAK